ncbi:Collagen alpha-5(VI) chain [Bulinus truncatus]|nr:Collagen alpha-5(VI) chain [Bulinus truncatus]
MLNKNTNYIDWAQKGECAKNPKYMMRNCRKACQKCVDGICQNFYLDAQCNIWASKNECEKNPAWMLKHCAKSCRSNKCQTDPNNSVDDLSTCKNFYDDAQCNIWANRQECQKNPAYMLKHCAKSCQTDPDNSVDDLLDCDNKNVNCIMWALRGECNENHSYMLKHCRKACQKCNDVECDNKNVNCIMWAQRGECSKNPSYMLKHCRKACRKCSDGQGTYTSRAFEMIQDDQFFSPSHGGRLDANDVVIIMTDGLSSDREETQRTADLLKADGITVIAVGIGSLADKIELEGMATDPKKHVFRIDSFDMLHVLKAELVKSACDDEL